MKICASMHTTGTVILWCPRTLSEHTGHVHAWTPDMHSPTSVLPHKTHKKVQKPTFVRDSE